MFCTFLNTFSMCRFYSPKIYDLKKFSIQFYQLLSLFFSLLSLFVDTMIMHTQCLFQMAFIRIRCKCENVKKRYDCMQWILFIGCWMNHSGIYSVLWVYSSKNWMPLQMTFAGGIYFLIFSMKIDETFLFTRTSCFKSKRNSNLINQYLEFGC